MLSGEIVLQKFEVLVIIHSKEHLMQLELMILLFCKKILMVKKFLIGKEIKYGFMEI
jgi:hypothetical protein